MKVAIYADSVRATHGPVAPHMHDFLNWVATQGYVASSIQRRARLALGFSQWLCKRRINTTNVSLSHCYEYLQFRARTKNIWPGDIQALIHLLQFLKSSGVTSGQIRRRPTPAEQHVEEYRQYLRAQRLLASSSIAAYGKHVARFVTTFFGGGAVKLSRLRAPQILEYVKREAARLQLKTVKIMATALRSFLRYAHYRDYIRMDLAAAVPNVANFSMSCLPRAIAPEQVNRLLAGVDQRTAVGRRNYAILLLLARLGLRAGEVAFLELDDIDWRSGCLTVRTKSGRPLPLPLPKDVGAAIIAYIKHGTSGRAVSPGLFVRTSTDPRFSEFARRFVDRS